MFILKLRKGITLLTILSVITLVVMSPATNSWASGRSNFQNNSLGNLSRSDTNVNNDIKTLNDGKDSSKNSKDSSLDTNITNNPLTMKKTILSIMVKSVKVEAYQKFIITINAAEPNPKTITFSPADRVVGLKPFDVEFGSQGGYQVVIENMFKYNKDYQFVLSSDCTGVIYFGDHKTCEIDIKKTPNIVVYTHAAANGTKASDFLLGIMVNNLVIEEIPGNEEGTKLEMGFNDEYHIYVMDPKGYFAQYVSTANVEDPDYYDKFWCHGTITDDGSPSLTKAKCYITIDISKLKVITKVVGGNTPIRNFKYKINTDDVTKTSANGKVYSGTGQGTEIPMQPGAFYNVQPLPPFNNYIPAKSPECDNMGELGKVKLCTLTMTNNIGQDSGKDTGQDSGKETCHLEINENGKPEQVC